MVEGKLGKFYEEFCLLDQPFIKDQSHTIAQIVAAKVAKLGENISRAPICAIQSGRGGLDRGADQTCAGAAGVIRFALVVRPGLSARALAFDDLDLRLQDGCQASSAPWLAFGLTPRLR